MVVVLQIIVSDVKSYTVQRKQNEFVVQDGDIVQDHDYKGHIEIYQQPFIRIQRFLA